jgi:uncharacterized protein YneR
MSQEQKPKKSFKVKKEFVLETPVLETPLLDTAVLETPLLDTAVTIKPKKIFKVKKQVVPEADYIITDRESKATEVFLILRDYYESKGTTVTEEDVKWYKEELERENKELAAFWEDCSVTKACLDAFARGETDEVIQQVQEKAKKEEKKKPLTEGDLGEKPAFGTPEFWAWAHKSKQLRLQKEAAIIAAGGTVPVKKVKKGKETNAV